MKRHNDVRQKHSFLTSDTRCFFRTVDLSVTILADNLAMIAKLASDVLKTKTKQVYYVHDNQSSIEFITLVYNVYTYYYYPRNTFSFVLVVNMKLTTWSKRQPNLSNVAL
jgi:hypothetical protein